MQFNGSEFTKDHSIVKTSCLILTKQFDKIKLLKVFATLIKRKQETQKTIHK
jgi:hypothetical protein